MGDGGTVGPKSIEGRQRPMLGRLPWFAFERRRRALRFLVFFDMGVEPIGAGSQVPPSRPCPACGTVAAVDIQGTCHPRFEAVRDVFVANFEQHGDVGASVAMTIDGEMVVDLWGGTVSDDANPGHDAGVPWERDTIINVWSTTKTMAAICCLVLADHGELDLHAPVDRVWPGFRAEGKHDVTTAHVLSHSAGLSGWQQPVGAEVLLDHQHAADLLAAQAPWWEPGTASGYHAITQGYLLGEIVRRVTGQTLGEFFAREVAEPLGADFHIGTGAEHDHRVAHVIAPSTGLDAGSVDPESIAMRTLSNPKLDAAMSSTVEWRRAEIPAAGGHGNARSVAHIHSVIACGGSAHGVDLMSRNGCERIFEEQISGTDLVLPMALRLGMGFGLNSAELPVSPNERACFWGGWGGSLAVIDLDARFSFAYVMNRMGEGTVGDLRGAGLLLTGYAALADE
jgi:CubicO group peptidase (beta-lactamase class C family)